MKKGLSFLVVVSVILAGICSAGAGEVGLIDMKGVILQSEAGKAAGVDLQKFIEGKKEQRTKLEGQLQKMQDDLKKQASVLSENVYKEKEIAYQKEYRNYKRFIEDTNAEMKLKDQELSQKLIPEVISAANIVGKKGGYTCIMDVGSGGIIYYDKENDLTKKVIEEYNKAYKAKK